MAATPLVTLLLATMVGQERLTPQGVLGGLLTVAGIGVLSIGTLGGELAVSYLIGVLVGVLSASGSTVIARKYRHVHPESMNAIGMAAGAVLLALGSIFVGEGWLLPAESSTWLALVWLVLLGSVGLFQLFLFVINNWSASAATFAISAMPVIAAGLGALVLDQPITIELVVGGAMVIVAVYIGAIYGKRRESEASDTAETGSHTHQAVPSVSDPQA